MWQSISESVWIESWKERQGAELLIPCVGKYLEKVLEGQRKGVVPVKAHGRVFFTVAFGFGAICGSVSGVTPGGLREPCVVLGIRLAACQASTLPLY